MRRLGAGDHAAVARLHRDLPLQDRYLRFFTAAPADADDVAARVLGHGVVAVGVFDRTGRLLGVAHHGPDPHALDPEIALAVSRPAQHRGVGTVLLEDLVDRARAAGVARLGADVLERNVAMLAVLRNSGLDVHLEPGDGALHATIEVAHPPPRYDEAVLGRAVTAARAGLRALLAPRSVAVIGVGRRPGSLGGAVLRSIRDGGFVGQLHVVHPLASVVAGVRCVPAVADLPVPVDLAVVCVPPAGVAQVVEDCGRRGVRSVAVVTPVEAIGSSALGEAAGRYGMRLIGPGSTAVINSSADVQLQASASGPVPVGEIGVAGPSATVIALGAVLSRLGLGVSSGVATGAARDVTVQDLLAWWSTEDRTCAAVVQFDGAAQFGGAAQSGGGMPASRLRRLVHRVARRIPLVVVGRSADGDLTPDGVLRADDVTAAAVLLAVLCLLPRPGPRIAVVGPPGPDLRVPLPAADELRAATPAPRTLAALENILGRPVSAAEPVEMPVTAAPATVVAVVDLLAADPQVDVVLAITVATSTGDPAAQVSSVALRHSDTPVVVVRLGQPEAVTALPGPRAHPVFAEVVPVVDALTACLRRATWLNRVTR